MSSDTATCGGRTGIGAQWPRQKPRLVSRGGGGSPRLISRLFGSPFRRYDVFRVEDVRKELSTLSDKPNMGGGRLPALRDGGESMMRRPPGLPGIVWSSMLDPLGGVFC